MGGQPLNRKVEDVQTLVRTSGLMGWLCADEIDLLEMAGGLTLTDECHACAG